NLKSLCPAKGREARSRGATLVRRPFRRPRNGHRSWLSEVLSFANGAPPAQPTAPAGGLVGDSQVHSASGEAPAHTCPGSLSPPGRVLVLINVFIDVDRTIRS